MRRSCGSSQFQSRVGPTRFERRPTILKRRESWWADAPLVPPYILATSNRTEQWEAGGRFFILAKAKSIWSTRRWNVSPLTTLPGILPAGRGYFSNRACSVSEFFKGWRRKAGLVTLAVACLLTVGWMRSLMRIDEIVLASHGDEGFLISSHDQGLWLVRYIWFGRGHIYDQSIQFVPDWLLILPLTLLSAWLILWEPRPAKSAKESSRA